MRIGCAAASRWSPDFSFTPRAERRGRWPGWARRLALSVLALSWSAGAVAQVDVTASAGTPAASYTTLTAAFAAINAGTHQGVIGIGLSGDTNEGATTAVLNASGAGAASYTAITISPTGGAARLITGTTTAGNPMIDLNGADNVRIDGLNTGGNSLTIANTTVSATSGTSTIRFIGGATSNVVTNTSLQGSGTSSVATNGAIIFFSTDAVTTNGNDNNTISNNSIGPAGANLPSKAILCNGSPTTTALGNSGNIIDNNNIFDYFAPAVTSSGIASNGGCNTWTISNNRLYQTATRTWTTGALHIGIDIRNTTATSGAQGFTITGNTVGFASNTQTGTYTLTGAGTGAKFLGILFNGIVAGTTTNVNNNTVAGVSMTGVTGFGTTTASPFTAMLLQEGNIISNGNTIGSQSAAGSLTFSTTTTTATDVYGIHNFTSNAWTSNNNSVGGISATNLGASGTFLLIGIRAFTGSAVTWNASGNTVGGTVANSIQLTATGAGSQVLGLFSSNAPAVLSNNTVRNLTTNIGTGTITTASVIGISLTSATPNHTLSQNTIHSLANTNATAASVVTGLQFNGAGANTVQRNRIHGLSVATNSAAAEVNGIRIVGGTTSYRNNMIAVGAEVPNAIGTGSTTGGVNGIFEAAGTNAFAHNSVYVGGGPTAGVGPSYAFASTQVTVARSVRNNIFFNARSNAGATGRNYVLRVAGTAPNPTGLTINNNLYFANGSGAVFGFFNGADVPNLGAWRTAVGQDALSFDSNPQFNDPTNATPDLHLHPTNPTPAETNGVDVGVVDDFDGQTRSGLTPTDIGADAGNFTFLDVSPPQISYTPHDNTALTTDRTLVVTLSDLSGVASGGFAPRIYYRKAAGAYFSQACSLAGGSVTNGTWNCIIVNADVGGVVTGDVISYFVVAQDIGGNLASNPTGATATDVNTITTPPSAPNSYGIVPPLAGNISVGTGETFTSLTNAGGVFEALNNSVVSSNVVIDITSDLLAETGTHALNPLSEKGVGNYTVVIRPSGAARVISGAFNGALIRINGADRVTIDGSIGGGGTDRSLTITNTSTTTPGVVLFGSVGTNPVTDGALRNTIIVNGANTSSAVVISDAAVVGAAGLFSNIVIHNNDIRRAFVGVFAQGGTTPQGGSNLTYTRNTVTATGTDAVRIVGLYMQGVNGATVSDNTIGNLTQADNENDVGIWLATGTINATVSGNTVGGLAYSGTGAFGPVGINVTPVVANSNILVSDNAVSNISSNGGATGSLARGIAVGGASSDLTIEKNDVQGITNTSTGTFPAYGIDLNGGNNVVLRNNFVSNVSFNMQGGGAFSTTFGVFGIRVAAGTGHRIYNNSVNLSGALPGTANTSLLTAAFGIVATTSTGLDVRDNIFANNIAGGTTSIAHVSVFLPAGGTSAMNLTWNNNAYFYGTDAARQGAGQAGTTAGTNFFTTLAALSAYTSTLSPAGTNDNASLESTGAVPFVSATDLHLQPASVLATAGVPLPGVTLDFDDEPRSATTPAIGADELVADLSISKTDGVTSATPGGSVTYTITASNAGAADTSATVADTFPASLTCTWTCVGAGGGTCTAAGSGNINDLVNLPAGGSVTYTASCTISPSATGSLANTATVTGAAGDPDTANNSATDTDTLTPSADLAITKTDGVTSATPGGSVTYTITAANTGPSNTTATVADTFPAILTCNTSCVGAGGGTCTAGPFAGNINDAVNLPAGASVTYTSSCTISAAATGSLSNTATVTGAATDPDPANNSATDTDTLNPSADLSITKTDGVTSATPGGSVTYTITAANAGPSNTTGTVADTFPASLTCAWTCVGAGGGTCSASAAGNINDAVNLPAGGSVTYSASCTISAAATGSLVNTATVTGAGTDPVPGNNSATDTDTLNPSADLSITKTDGVTSATPGGSVTYTITASNAGPSNATGATVADTFPASLTCTWTCVGAGGGTCTASSSGNINDTVNLPSGGSVTYTASCTISASATGTLVNTATVAAPAGVTDPVPGNNAATDTDTLVLGALSISGSPVAFGSVTVGTTTAAQTVTLSNTGTASLQVTVLDAPSAPFARSGGNCGALPITIAAGANCTLDYTYSPTATVTSNQTLTVTADAPGSGTIELGGTGVQGTLAIVGSPVAFGSVDVGDTSAPQTVTLSNTGSASLQVTVLDAPLAPFARSGGNCGGLPITLGVGVNCTLEYTFTPTTAGAVNQTLTVTADAPGSGTISLGGTGANAPAGNLTITPDSQGFGNVAVGQSSAVGTITLENTGTASLDVTSLTLAASPFVRTNDGSCGNSLPITIAAGASCTLSYQFVPTATGPAQQNFTLGASAPGETSFELTGTGTPGVPLIFRDGFEEP
jgi:uncharacterized repeat protein (TIGR01451 family)